MLIPTIHRNGTSRNALLEQYENAYRKLTEALEALQSVDVNARDYYPQGPEAGIQARKEHEARLRKLQEVRVDIGTIWESLNP